LGRGEHERGLDEEEEEEEEGTEELSWGCGLW
jgi:hypothetical protein